MTDIIDILTIILLTLQVELSVNGKRKYTSFFFFPKFIKKGKKEQKFKGEVCT